MLSRKDIEKELGKGLCFYPLIPSNIKENSINVTISKYAWCQDDATIYWYGNDKFSLTEDPERSQKALTYHKGQRPIFADLDKKIDYLLLLPHQTTIIETEEVIGIGINIGGAVHSKVGIVVQGIGDTGTMLGPGYCGHLMVSLHNITNDVVALKVGETFVSLTFDYLNTSVVRTSSTVSSHYDRLLEYDCILDAQEKAYFVQDWKNNFASISEQMCNSSSYQQFKKQLQKNKLKNLRHCINRKNIVSVLCVVFVFLILYLAAYYIDSRTKSSIWVDRFWNVGCSGLVVSLLMGIWKWNKQ